MMINEIPGHPKAFACFACAVRALSARRKLSCGASVSGYMIDSRDQWHELTLDPWLQKCDEMLLACVIDDWIARKN